VIPVPPAIRPIFSCLPINCLSLWGGPRILVFLPFVFRNWTAHFEKLTGVHVVKVRTHRSILILFDQQIKSPLPPSTHYERELDCKREFGSGKRYLLIDVGDGSVGSDGGLFIGGTLVHGQKTGIDDESQRRILLWQFERKQLRIVIDIGHLRQLRKVSNQGPSIRVWRAGIGP
jgi:hypothetical protein